MADPFIPESTKPETSEAVERLAGRMAYAPLRSAQHALDIISRDGSAKHDTRLLAIEESARIETAIATLSAPPARQNVERMREAFQARVQPWLTASQIAYDGGETHRSAPRGGDRIAVRFGEQGKWWNGISDAHRAAIRRDPSYGIEEAFNAGWKAALAAAPSVAIGAGEVTQADRDTAADILDGLSGYTMDAAHIRSGDMDHNEVVQRIARHRLDYTLTPPSASIPADVEREEALREALKPFAMIAPHVEHTDKRDGDVAHRQAIYLGSG